MAIIDRDRYLTSWERFWSTLTGASGEVFWDADAGHAAQEDIARFGTQLDPQLPLLDVGCGNGTQTRFLSQHFTRVIGTEISPAALTQAKASGIPTNVCYRLFDLLQPVEAQALHAEIGDGNVYMRTVLHQFASADQEIAARSLGYLLGRRGTLYFNELSSAAELFFADLIERHGLPPGLARVFQSGITPGMLSEADLERLFPRNVSHSSPPATPTFTRRTRCPQARRSEFRRFTLYYARQRNQSKCEKSAP